jgi:uncharacterized membrane protein YhaH (DUF805 family)
MWGETFKLKHLIGFKGRATRREFLAIYVLWFVSGILPSVLVSLATGKDPPEWVFGVSGLWMLASVLVVFAAAFRRLHDQGNSAAFLLLALVPVVGWIFLLIMLLYPGQTYENEYGPDPREIFYGDAEKV